MMTADTFHVGFHESIKLRLEYLSPISILLAFAPCPDAKKSLTLH
jgi:hypothetical protein